MPQLPRMFTPTLIGSALLTSTLVPALALGQTGTLHTLPIPSGALSAFSAGVSGDNSTIRIVGFNSTTLAMSCLVQRIGGQNYDLGILGPRPFQDQGQVNDLNTDGTVLYGGPVGGSDPNFHPFRWQAPGPRTDLPIPAGLNSWATGPSPDGSYIVGYTLPAGASNYRACRWIGTNGPQLLADVPASVSNYATFVAPNGEIFGTATIGGRLKLVRWLILANGDSQADIISDQGVPTSANLPADVSRNAAVFFGSRRNVTQVTQAVPFMQIRGRAPVDLPIPPGCDGAQVGQCSKDGSAVTVVGYLPLGGGVSQTINMIWTTGRGLQTLNDYLLMRGADLTGWSITRISLRSNTGTRISGVGLNQGVYTAFYVDLPPRCVADLDDGTDRGETDNAVTLEDLTYFLNAYSAETDGADIDDGSETGTRDGSVTLEDLTFFLARYEAGC